ncbi:MAG: diguanylate cyclase [Burkholderiaceae bacterium]|nr:diguanylate cyclase [Burkholderiaceae bacterium]
MMNENIAQRLRYCSTLPSLPGVAIRIIDLANKPDTSMVQICEQVSLDPALSAKFLKVARSPLYLTRRAANNVRQAVSLLGTHASIMIALSFSLMHSFRANPDSKHIDTARFWRRAVLCALACRALGEKCGLKKLDDLFLAGLMQDIGVLVFDVMMPDEYAPVNLAATGHDALLQAEHEAFGAGHDEVGYWLLKRWKLPDYLALSCLASHSLTQEKEAMSKMTACIAVSGYIADQFLNMGNREIASRAVAVAKEFLELDDDGLAGVLDAVAMSLPEAEDLFDISLLDASEISAIMGEARDLQMLRQLKKSRELELNSQRDALTGAHNRGYFDTILEREFDLSSRHGWPLSVAMIDLDHFKTVNDMYGHQVGDAVLISVVRAVQGVLRPDDIFARYGGEEFVVVLPGTSLENTLRVLDRLRESISSLEHFPTKGEPLRITASIGVATHMDAGQRFERIEDIVTAIDQAMYLAKNRGRNRIEMWRQ